MRRLRAWARESVGKMPADESARNSADAGQKATAFRTHRFPGLALVSDRANRSERGCTREGSEGAGAPGAGGFGPDSMYASRRGAYREGSRSERAQQVWVPCPVAHRAEPDSSSRRMREIGAWMPFLDWCREKSPTKIHASDFCSGRSSAERVPGSLGQEKKAASLDSNFGFGFSDGKAPRSPDLDSRFWILLGLRNAARGTEKESGARGAWKRSFRRAC